MFLVLFGVIIIATNVNSKINSPCKGFDDTTCVNIENDFAYSYVHPRCSKVTNRVTTQMETFYAADLITRAEMNPSGACVYFNKIYVNGQQEPNIACMELIQAEKFCPNLATNETNGHYKLQACVMCGSKYYVPSSGEQFGPQNIIYFILIGSYFWFMM